MHHEHYKKCAQALGISRKVYSLQQPIIILLKSLWHHISRRRRRQFGLLLVLMVLTAFTEILSIGAVLPFLGVLTAPDRVFELPIAQPVIQILNLTEPKQLLMPLTVAFGIAWRL